MIRIIDLEVDNREWYGQVASLNNPQNYIVEAGWLDAAWGASVDYSAVQTHRNNSLEESKDASWFNLDGVSLLVAHNAAYELKCLHSTARVELEKFLKRGGRVLCTQYAEYLLSDFQHQYPALDEVAPDYGGTQKVDGIKLLWEQGVLTSEIDPELLHEYLAGPEGDVVNTAKTFFGQVKRLQERGQWRLFLERCEALLAFAYCEIAGLKVDTDVAYRNLAEQEQELAELYAGMQQYLPKDMPPELEFSWGNRWDISAALFGGARPYRRRVPYVPTKYVKADFYKTVQDGTLIPVQEVTDNFSELPELVRFKSGKRKGQVKVFREDTAEEALKWEEFTYAFQPLIPIDSLPKVLAENFGERGEWRGAQTQRDGTPVYNTAEETLVTLSAHGFPAALHLVRIGSINKDIGSFYIKHSKNADGDIVKSSGMLQYVQPNGIINHQLNLTATVTGRLSASKPNTQQLPRADEDDEGVVKSKVKEMFVSRFKGGKIVQVDYSALEVVMLAALTDDKDLLKHMQAGTDMHCFRLAAKLKEPYEEVLKKCKDSSHPQHNSYAKMRNDIKPPSFAAQYGATAPGIAYATGCTVEYAEEFLATEAELFPISIGYREVIRAEVERTGSSSVHREQLPDGTWKLYKRGYWQSPGGNRYSFRQHEQWNHELRQRIMDYRSTQIANYWVQGEAFYLMALSAGRVIRWLLANNFFRDKVFLINNVHDALYLDCHPDYAERAAQQVKRIMEDAPKYMSEHLGYDIAHVPFPAEAVWGYSMQQENKFK